MYEFSKLFGEAVRRNRRQMRLSQDKLAESIGFSKRTILEIENYKRYAVNPKMETVYALAKFLHLDAREFFNPAVQMESPAVQQLHLLVNQCSEDEAKHLLEILKPALNALRSVRETNI